MATAIVFFGFPFLYFGLGVLSIIELLGQSWHRPHLVTRALGLVGLFATFLIGLQWLVVAAGVFLELMYAVAAGSSSY